jgi:hypothetical protein
MGSRGLAFGGLAFGFDGAVVLVGVFQLAVVEFGSVRLLGLVALALLLDFRSFFGA